ncbi:amino acid permease [Paenibacillus sp. GCM10012307]|uniref:Amino acid permease n=1 Tax=Paenibacillus roseus TaxID=2798579 RepID=A0A934IVB9_9BACL|nr:amino acid permease [Paenibacillus roseus]MBJ6360001.1 amino acid permease [Paenibacillus roseus]
MDQTVKNLPWWQLALFGVGCTIGSGFFLGSSLAIRKSGLLVLLLFLLAAIATLCVFEALAQMTVNSPQKGSFRTYAKKAYGRWAGFLMGWTYWCSEILIMGSTLTALGLFSQLWFPAMPLWAFTAVYAILGLGVVVLGSKGVNKAENFFAVIKIAALLMFICVAVLGLVRGAGKWSTLHNSSAWLGEGWQGPWKGLLYAFYAFGGIEVMGFMAADLQDPKDAPKAGRVMLLAVTVLYMLTAGLSLMFVSHEKIVHSKSPIVAAFEAMHLPFFVHLINAVMIIAGFSILVASLYAVSTMLVTLAQDKDAPKWLAITKGKRELPLYALGMNALGLCMSILLGLLLPKQIFEHITTAAGLVILYTWLFILATYLKLLKPGAGGWVKSCTAILLIVAAVSGVLLESSGRPGFWSSLMLLLVIGLITLYMQHKWKIEEPEPH